MNIEKLSQKRDYYLTNKHILSNEIIQNIEKDFEINYTFNSTTIEGNTLTLAETKLVLEDKISIGGKNLRDIYEVTNHNKAFKYIEKCVINKEELNENKIKDIHEILMENIMQGGVYRNTDVKITGAKHNPPSPIDMYNQLKFFYEDLKNKGKELNEIMLAAWTHGEFVKIHPFIDGNGRTSRLIMNYQLIKNSFLPVSIDVNERLKYYETLDNYHITGNLEPFGELIYELENERLDEVNRIIQQAKNG